MAELEGQQLGNYRLIRLLGQGGFADVYQGEHIHLGTQTAIKVLRTRITPENAALFLNEAKIIAHLDHPNIVRVLEFGVENGTPFLVMDYAINGTLRQRHPKGTQLPLALVVPYVQQAAGALQYAHNQKVIHRDLKPENMLLGKRGEILLSDFGLALTTQSSRYDSTQDIVGTVAYMAPEQLQGKPSTMSDQYALGITVYEWLGGERPFHGSFMEIYSQHMASPPPSLCAKVPELPEYVEQAIFIALAKDPTERFQSVQAFANALTNASQAMDRSSGEATARHTPSLTPLPPANQPTSMPLPSTNQSTSIPMAPSPTPLPSTNQPLPLPPTNQSTPMPMAPSPTPLPSTNQSSLTTNSTDTFSTRMMSNQQPTPTPSGAITPPPNFFPHQPQPGMVIPQQPIMPPPPIPALEKSRPQLVNNEAITSGKAPHQPKRKNKGGKIIAVLAAIVLIALFGVLAIPRLNLPLPTLGLGPHPTATSSTSASAPTTVTQPTQGVTPVNTATNPISTDTPAATVAPSVGLTTTSPTLPLTISCVQCGYPDLALVLMSITANADNSTTLWTFTVTNKGASQCSSITFATLALEGPDGTQYQSSGQASNSWSLNAGTATNVSPTLALVPRSGTIYTLNIQLNGSCMTSSDNTYQTEDLNFAPSLLTGEGPVTPNTISPKSPSLPLNITCVQCGYPQLSLTLTSITVTASNSSTVWSFTITNNGSTACSNITFAQFQLEDPSGTQYQSSGQVRDSWSLNAGSSVAESPTLSFQPQPNTIYTLNIRLNGSCMSFSDNTYQTENVQF